jgi:hypothetical protein
MTTARKIGVLTIGQAPRADDTVAELSDCMGYSLAMKARAKAAAGSCPVVLARSAIARVLAEVAG